MFGSAMAECENSPKNKGHWILTWTLSKILIRVHTFLCDCLRMAIYLIEVYLQRWLTANEESRVKNLPYRYIFDLQMLLSQRTQFQGYRKVLAICRLLQYLQKEDSPQKRLRNLPVPSARTCLYICNTKHTRCASQTATTVCHYTIAVLYWLLTSWLDHWNLHIKSRWIVWIHLHQVSCCKFFASKHLRSIRHVANPSLPSDFWKLTLRPRCEQDRKKGFFGIVTSGVTQSALSRFVR